MPGRRPSMWLRNGAVLVAGALAAVACSSPPVPPAHSLSTGDGLRLGFDREGRVTAVAVGGDELRVGAPGGFSVRAAGGTPNLLPDPGFEADGDADGVPDGWAFSSDGPAPVLERGAAHAGDASVRVASSSFGSTGAVEAVVDVRPYTHYVVSAWMRGEGIQPTKTPTSFSPARLVVEQLTGRVVVGTSYAFGYTDTSGWNRQFVGLQTGGGVNHLRLRGLIERGSGTLWFDDLSVGELLEPSVAVTGGVVSTATGLEQRADLPGDSLHVEAAYRATADHVEVRASLRATDGADHPFQLTFTLPVDAKGWFWGDDPRRSRRIAGGDYAALSSARVQVGYEDFGGLNQIQQTSRFPLGVIGDGRAAVAIGVPLADPRLFRIGYDERGLSVTFDLGVSPSATRLGARADVTFAIYAPPGAWGFRSALERYYRLYPEQFVRRTDPAREGTWFFAPPLDSLPGDAPRDFGLGLNVAALGKAPPQTFSTWGTRYVPWDNARHLYASAYTHEWAFFMPSERVRSYGDATTLLEKMAAGKGIGPLQLATVGAGPRSGDAAARLRAEAAAALLSTARDVNGRRYFERYRGFLAWYQNLSGGQEDRAWPATVQRQQIDRAMRLAREAGGHLDGIHLDSTSGMRRWGTVDDYDRDHWATAELPLTFSYNSGQVVQRGILAIYEQIRRVARFAHDRGMVLSANFNGGASRSASWVGADQIDYFGLEQGLPERAEPGPQGADELALFERALAGQRPISSLDTRIAEGLPPAAIEERLQQNLFYGIFPGAWTREENEGEQTEATWTTPAKRARYARYTPLFREVAAAGWEPVTDAVTTNPNVWVERYGSIGDGDLLFTVRNDTGAQQTFDLRLQPEALGGAGAVQAAEEVSGQAATVHLDGSGAVIEGLFLPPRSTRVLRVTS